MNCFCGPCRPRFYGERVSETKVQKTKGQIALALFSSALPFLLLFGGLQISAIGRTRTLGELFFRPEAMMFLGPVDVNFA
jgi:hypothetical protein